MCFYCACALGFNEVASTNGVSADATMVDDANRAAVITNAFSLQLTLWLDQCLL